MLYIHMCIIKYILAIIEFSIVHCDRFLPFLFFVHGWCLIQVFAERVSRTYARGCEQQRASSTQ